MNDAPPTAIKELRHWPQWVIWRIDARDGKTTKIPLMARSPGTRASSTDSKTWAPYEATLKPVEKGRADGIGFVFTPGDEYFGIDLDHCVKDGVVHPKAMEIVQRMNTYTEFSPSGDGLHIIGRGRLKGDRNRTKKTPWGHDFEVYDNARFFTMTGRQLFGSPATIEPRQDELDAIYAEMFPAPAPVKNSNGRAAMILVPGTLDDVALEEKIRSSKQGAKFAELFDRGAPEDQESEADLGLCNILAFWLGPDEARIDAWFRRSALIRDKWDAKRGDTTYGGYTIDRALEGRTEFYGQKIRPAARPKDDDTELSYADELAGFFGLIDDTFVSGWRSSRRATCRVVLSTRGGLVFDVDNWKSAPSSARALAQEIRLQIGTDPSIKKDDLGRLDVLVGQFCKVVQAMTVQDRAVELGRTFLQEAETLDVDLDNQAERYAALKQLKDRHPTAKAKADGTSTVAACIVLRDNVDRRYVRISWFVDFVKANAVSSQVGAIVEAMESPGMWSRLNDTKSRMKGTDPVTKDHVWQALYEVPANWPEETV